MTLLYLEDLLYAIWASVLVQFNRNTQEIERRLYFLEDAVESFRRQQLPYKLLYGSLSNRLKQLKK